MPPRRQRSGSVPDTANVIPIKAQPVPAVTKAVAMIRFINERGPAGAALSEISDLLRITRSHCFNILRTLVSWTVKPKWRDKRANRDAMWQGVLDFLRRRWGKQGS